MKEPEQWQISGDAAELYERYAVPYLLGPWAESLVDAAAVSCGDRVLDIACGTGVVTRIAAQRAGKPGRVVGLDLNPGMLAVARSLPSAAAVEWLQRSALDLGLRDASFDVVLCQQGLQFFPDRSLAMREMHRVLDKGGRLALSVWNNAGVYNSAVGAVLDELLGRDIASRFRASRNVPGKEEILRLVTAAGFRDVGIRVGKRDVHLPAPDKFVLSHLASTPIAAAIAEAKPDLRARIGARVVQRLEPYADGDGVTFPEETHLVTARA
jgi:SAM-dependent methyltransferase